MTKKEIKKLKNCQHQKMMCEAELMELLVKSKEVPKSHTRHHHNINKQMGRIKRKIKQFEDLILEIKSERKEAI
jgi:tRNA A58 N-methylase Trm61